MNVFEDSRMLLLSTANIC